jgi:hypothetical protein
MHSNRESLLESHMCIGILASRDSGFSGFPPLLLCYLCNYISYGRIGYCLVLYTVLCLGDHLCNGTQYGDCTDTSEAFPMTYGNERS